MVTDGPEQDDRLLRIEEKRAPRLVPWRPDKRETFAGIAIVAFALVATAWLTLTILQKDEIGWRSDGIVVEVRERLGDTPRASVTTVARAEESYPWAFPPDDFGSGSCNNPRFQLDGMPERGRVYDDGDELSVRLNYYAPGCRDIRVTFAGDGHFSSDRVNLVGTQGVVTITANPGTEADVAASSPPGLASFSPRTLEGFKLCSIIIFVSDGAMNGSQSSQQVYVECSRSRDFSEIRFR